MDREIWRHNTVFSDDHPRPTSTRGVQVRALHRVSEPHTLVCGLAAAFDGEVATPPDFSGLPSGDELAAELARFLRGEQEGD